MRIVGIDILCEIPCKDYSNAYISETGRSLMEIVREHKYTVKRYDKKNGIAAHTHGRLGTGLTGQEPK